MMEKIKLNRYTLTHTEDDHVSHENFLQVNKYVTSDGNIKQAHAETHYEVNFLIKITSFQYPYKYK